MPGASGWLSVSEAADRLGVHPTRVLPLLASGRLRGNRHGGRWEIDPESVVRFASTPRPSGRPLDPHNAWKVLALLCQGDLDVPLDTRDRRRLGALVARLTPEELVGRLRRRSLTLRRRAHPSALPRLARDVVTSGVLAARRGGGDDVVASGELEGYLPAGQLHAVGARHHLVDQGRPNVILHLVDDALWPFPPRLATVPPAVAAVDLLEAGDERSARAGRRILSTAQRQATRAMAPKQ
jgi:excisionase family DNA binding protein